MQDSQRLSDKLLLDGIREVSEKIADLQDEIVGLRESRDDMIRKAIEERVKRVQISRAAGLSAETLRNIEFHRYSRESRRKPVRNPGPARD